MQKCDQSRVRYIRKIETPSEGLSAGFLVELKYGLGTHDGRSIVGIMGYAEAVSRTAIWDNVHVASHLEEMTKKYILE